VLDKDILKQDAQSIVKKNAGFLIKHFSAFEIDEWNLCLSCRSKLLLIMHKQLLL